jgi:hypothetical protein
MAAALQLFFRTNYRQQSKDAGDDRFPLSFKTAQLRADITTLLRTSVQ